MKQQIALLLSSWMACAAQAQQAISFKAAPETFEINATASGHVSKSGPFLKVHLDRQTVWRTKVRPELHGAYSYRVGLASNNTNGIWAVLRWSDSVSISAPSGLADSIPLPPTTLRIPIDGLQTLEGTWLVLQLTLANKRRGTEDFTYAHGDGLTLK